MPKGARTSGAKKAEAAAAPEAAPPKEPSLYDKHEEVCAALHRSVRSGD